MSDRVIKYRVWDQTEKVWQRGCSIGQDGRPFSEGGKERGSWIIQFYTGLLDRNGKEIYEGDIVKLIISPETIKKFYKGSENTFIPLILEEMEDGAYKGEVKFDGGEGIASHFSYYVGFISFSALKSLTGRDNIEIIGNIFENAELMK